MLACSHICLKAYYNGNYLLTVAESEEGVVGSNGASAELWLYSASHRLAFAPAGRRGTLTSHSFDTLPPRSVGDI